MTKCLSFLHNCCKLYINTHLIRSYKISCFHSRALQPYEFSEQGWKRANKKLLVVSLPNLFYQAIQNIHIRNYGFWFSAFWTFEHHNDLALLFPNCYSKTTCTQGKMNWITCFFFAFYFTKNLKHFKQKSEILFQLQCKNTVHRNEQWMTLHAAWHISVI